MKRWLFYSLVAAATFTLGCGFVFGVRAVGDFAADKFSIEINALEIVETNRLEIAHISEESPPVFDPTPKSRKSSKVKLLQTGWFHSEEVPYRTGERWLGLFRIGTGYELRKTKIKVRRTNGDLFNREVSTSDSSDPIFMLRGADNLPLGSIVTVFDDLDGENLFDFTSGKGFGLSGSFWWLSIENAGPNGVPQKGSSLVLKQTGYDPQILRALPSGCNDCNWRLLWAGDLNGDNNLEFFIDISGHYNIYQPVLFMYTPGHGYVAYASFEATGC